MSPCCAPSPQCSDWWRRTRRCHARSTASPWTRPLLVAIDIARAAARARAWELAGDHAPDHQTDAGQPLVIDVDATLVTAHSDKEGAAPTFKRGYGHHPLWAFVDHGPAGTGEPLAALLRPGNAGSNTAADHLTVIRAAGPAAITCGSRAER
jgi:hypothetical protein